MSISLGDTPKSILKKPSLPTPAEARRIAITHASSLQIRKVLEASVLDSLLYLLDLPTPPITKPGDCHHLRFFTPSDYDSLLEERNILNLCGYTLCPLPQKKRGSSRLALSKSGHWVDRKQVERFCSDSCAKKALWVRVQLNPEPAWTRKEVVGCVEVDQNTGEVRGVDLDSEEPAEGWEPGWSLLEDGMAEEEVKRPGMSSLVDALQAVGIRDEELKRERNTPVTGQEILVDVLEREMKSVMISAPGEDLDEDMEDRTAAIEGYVPKAQRAVDRDIDLF
ncbi:Rtr1/RPAP2 family-domain-containing protein [Pyronema omphalodes]|nr:Rtr1/RPAP2 family-domain-containing protein [Pyronema omphalodes]